MKNEHPFPSTAFENLLNYCNSYLPYYKLGTDSMMDEVEFLEDAFSHEFEMAIKTLPPASLRAYGEWLDKKMYEFDVLGYESSYNPITGLYSVDCHPKNLLPLLDSNPELQALKFELAHKCIVILNKLLDDLDEEVWKLHPALAEGRYPDNE